MVLFRHGANDGPKTLRNESRFQLTLFACTVSRRGELGMNAAPLALNNRFLVALPEAAMSAAPLALNRYARGAPDPPLC